MHGVAMRLQFSLERIALLDGDLVNGADVHYEIVDGVLHFFITYKMVVRYSGSPEESMGGVAVDSRLKGDL